MPVEGVDASHDVVVGIGDVQKPVDVYRQVEGAFQEEIGRRHVVADVGSPAGNGRNQRILSCQRRPEKEEQKYRPEIDH